MATVVLVGTLDTKGHEYAYLRDRLREHGVDVLLVDVGVNEPLVEPDIGREEAARVQYGDRGAAVEAMARGAEAVVSRLHEEGRLDGILALGGSGGTAIATQAMRALPVGVPKLMVSTMASGDTRPYVGAVDVTMTYSVVDIAGINAVSARILSNAAAAMAGMAKAAPPEAGEGRPLVGASMFGVTTPCVTAARERLEELGYEVLVFHATGTGGQSMEALMRGGFLTAVLDVTTTELADDLVGGVLSAGPDRLEAAGELGLPQVVSLGALDMVNFGPPDTVPERFRDRLFYEHNPTVTLMRTTPEECAELGRRIARKLNAARGPVTLFVPLRGVSMIAVEGQPFHDPEADEALLSALREELVPSVDVRELDTDINDAVFAAAMAERLHELAGARV
jgi:uncharacterized protein (UPF0261 family)